MTSSPAAPGNNTLDGGAGIDDIVSYMYDPYDMQYLQPAVPDGAADANLGVTANLLTGTATNFSGGTDSLSGFENIVGTFFNDNLTGDTGNNGFDGLSGNDVIDGGDGIDTVYYGLFDNDGRSQHLIPGLNGSDPNGVTVNLATHTANDGEGGTDTLTNIENVVGSRGNDTIIGDANANRLEGEDGNDTLDGGAGLDILVGGFGNDTYVLGADNDTVDDGGGIDTITSSVTRSLAGYATIENLTLTGASAINGTGNNLDNVITGNDAANSLSGAGGNDTLIGGGGNDSLSGGTGNDTMTGGDGSDIYYRRSLSATSSPRPMPTSPPAALTVCSAVSPTRSAPTSSTCS